MKAITVPQKNFNVQITISSYEAAVLLKIFRNIGGPLYHSPRKVTDELSKQLIRLGIEPADAASSGSIQFLDNQGFLGAPLKDEE